MTLEEQGTLGTVARPGVHDLAYSLAVSITLYHMAMAGFREDPIAMILNREGMVELGAWPLAHPRAMYPHE